MPGLQLVVLCEDKQHEAFASRFLKMRGFERRFRVEKAGDRPAVFRRFEQEVRTLRAMRNRRPSLRLVVVVDADEDDPAILRRQHTGPDSTVAGVFPDVADIVAVFLPKRNIETWIRFLEGDPYDEETKYPKKYRGCERKCIDGVRELDRHCESRRFPSAPPPSLARACEEFDRVLRS